MATHASILAWSRWTQSAVFCLWLLCLCCAVVCGWFLPVCGAVWYAHYMRGLQFIYPFCCPHGFSLRMYELFLVCGSREYSGR